MKIKIITAILIISTISVNSQELKHSEIKERIYSSIEANFSNRFNTYIGLKDIFYGKCNEYKKHCQKLKFDKITDFRIIEIANKEGIELDNLSNDYYRVEASFDFSYNAEKIDHYGNGIVECVIQKVIDGYEIDYIKIIGVKGLHEYYESVEDEEFYILNRLVYED